VPAEFPAANRLSRAKSGFPAILLRLRADDPTRPVADALLDQRALDDIGNLWKNETLFRSGIDPWRTTADVSDEDLDESCAPPGT
jgi:formamidopyrimidine-DNA glycosylase